MNKYCVGCCGSLSGNEAFDAPSDAEMFKKILRCSYDLNSYDWEIIGQSAKVGYTHRPGLCRLCVCSSLCLSISQSDILYACPSVFLPACICLNICLSLYVYYLSDYLSLERLDG